VTPAVGNGTGEWGDGGRGWWFGADDDEGPAGAGVSSGAGCDGVDAVGAGDGVTLGLGCTAAVGGEVAGRCRNDDRNGALEMEW
jgi:hypothetical protein